MVQPGKFLSVIPLIGLWTLILTSTDALASEPMPEAEVKGVWQVPLTDKAYAGSSVNVVAGSRQTLFTDGGYQYAGFYNARGRLVLAKRRLPHDDWDSHTTGFGTEPTDAHNTISLVVDGQGYLHLTWGHHNSALNYSRSLKPGGLAMGEPDSMVGEAEASVTYPQFFRRANGDLLFLYRDGGSGNGRLLLNHYDLEREQWTRRQDNLIDGEGQRSAYWDMAIDEEGHLHLAWNWRETPDVASNHDLLYARSNDGGRTWKRTDGTDYALPITQKTAEVAAAIGQRRNLMNPPFVSVDGQGRPIIVSYWSPTEGARPCFNLVYWDHKQWRTLAGPRAEEPFTLQGHGTKRPPISRAVLLTEPDKENTRVHLIYRDDSKGERVLAASLDHLQATQWQMRYLTEKAVGGWEPSVDPEQWRRKRQVHLMLQAVGQVDGDDRDGSESEPTPLSVLVWEPSRD